MNPSRLALWLIGAAVCGAWFASAAGVTRQARITPSAQRPANVVQLDALAVEVQSQAERLRHKLATAPAPAPRSRNPFAFDSAPARVRTAARRAEPVAELEEPAVTEPRQPSIALVGIAESKNGEDVVRTAMLTGEFIDLIMVTAGQQILGRYEVISVTENAVELKDLETSATRRLILR
jgi:hypothetical protein